MEPAKGSTLSRMYEPNAGKDSIEKDHKSL